MNLTPKERQVAAGQIDYVIITSRPYRVAEPAPLDLALQRNPALTGAGQGATVRLALAELEPGPCVLALSDLRCDLLDLTLARRPLAIAFAPLDDQDAGNGAIGTRGAAEAIYPDVRLQEECLSLPGRQGQAFCKVRAKRPAKIGRFATAW